MSDYSITHLRELEAEAIYVIREVGAQFEKPTLLFSGGKDSIVMYHLARKAFYEAVEYRKDREHYEARRAAESAKRSSVFFQSK